MHFAFQDRENLYLVIDMMSGGDLRYHFGKYRKFDEKQTCILKGIMWYNVNFYRILHSMYAIRS